MANTAPATIAIVGDGPWMRMLTRLARDNGVEVIIWPGLAGDAMPSSVTAKAIREAIGDDDGVTITEEAASAAAARNIVLATESWRVRHTAVALADHLRGYHRVIHTVRGLESSTLMRGSTLIKNQTPVRQVAAMVGPMHPDLHGAGKPGSCVVGSKFPDIIADTQATFGGPTFRVYGNLDLVGVELAGAAARAIAVGVGIIDGLNLGPSVRGTLVARGVAEMSRFGQAFGANPATFAGLAGLGYLTAQASEPVGVDVQIGRALVSGMSPKDIQDSFGPDAVELFEATLALARSIANKNVDAHIIPALAGVFDAKKTVPDIVKDLLSLSQMME